MGVNVAKSGNRSKTKNLKNERVNRTENGKREIWKWKLKKWKWE